jgi:hypothetical protein
VQEGSQQPPSRETQSHSPSHPLVDEGTVRDVPIETVDDQGDSIANAILPAVLDGRLDDGVNERVVIDWQTS